MGNRELLDFMEKIQQIVTKQSKIHYCRPAGSYICAIHSSGAYGLQRRYKFQDRKGEEILKKRFFVFLFAVAVAVAMSACGKKDDGVVLHDSLNIGSVEYENVSIMGVTYDFYR